MNLLFDVIINKLVCIQMFELKSVVIQIEFVFNDNRIKTMEMQL